MQKFLECWRTIMDDILRVGWLVFIIVIVANGWPD